MTNILKRSADIVLCRCSTLGFIVFVMELEGESQMLSALKYNISS